MSENCTPEMCETCSSDCASKKGSAASDFRASLSAGSSVRHVIAVMSGKGGVGKSLVSCLLADAFCALGYRTAILDADITGPSIARAYSLSGEDLSVNADMLMVPPRTSNGIHVMSANLMLQNEEDPIVWRGSLIASAVKQFYSETLWEDIDYMFVDMPPGTGDVPLTVFQSLPVDGIIMVTSPQDLVTMIVAKAVGMAKLMNIPILGIIENMSYFICPDCGGRHYIFGESDIKEIALSFGTSLLASIPIDPLMAWLMDSGMAERLDTSYVERAAAAISALERFEK